ncbi:MAG: glutathione S-transferase [Hyphomonas sp. 34-62-18]|nr:glutathione S-transferase family protein [Hyphomonas sp. 34-62-18]OZB18690.1 MAG: glutathione S-transferase [Hyphomonas sp. 34-62-18]
MSLVFYTNPLSRGRIVRWMLEETGAPYETRFVRYGEEMNSPDFAAINPMRKVPALVHNGRVVTECGAICLYLADVFPEAGLAPPLADRASYYRWMMFAAGPWEQANINAALGVQVTPEQSRMAGYGTFERALDVLLSLVPDTGYMLGGKFSALDVYAGSHIDWAIQFGSIPATPKIATYLDRIQSRPAARRALELDEAAAAEYGPPA